MEYVKTSSKFQIVIPKNIRGRLNIKAGQRLCLKVVEGHLELHPVFEDPIEGLTGLFKGCEPSLTADLIKDRRAEYEREEKDRI